jgi:hypothetical protein
MRATRKAARRPNILRWTAEEIRGGYGPSQWIIFDENGAVRYFVERFNMPEEGVTEWHPYKVFEPILGQGRPHFGRMLGVDYGAEGPVQAAASVMIGVNRETL